jgi:site-specific DNA-methyltransferase (adenine-specific)
VHLAPPELGPEPDPEHVHRPDWAVNRLLEGDCLERLSEVPDRSVHLVLCDLPYGTTQNRWDSVIPLEPLWAHYRRVLVPRGVVVLTGQGPFTARLILSNEAWFKYKWTWVKSKPTNFLNAKRQPLRRHEDVCVFYGRQCPYTPQMQPGAAYDKGVRKNQLTGSYGEFSPVRVRTAGGRYPTDVVYFRTAESEGEVWHPTQKPVALARYFVRTYTRPGEVVLDSAFGSGSLLVGAVAEGRNVIGVELNDGNTRFKASGVDLLAIARARLDATLIGLDPRRRGWLAAPAWASPSHAETQR